MAGNPIKCDLCGIAPHRAIVYRRGAGQFMGKHYCRICKGICNTTEEIDELISRKLGIPLDPQAAPVPSPQPILFPPLSPRGFEPVPKPDPFAKARRHKLDTLLDFNRPVAPSNVKIGGRFGKAVSLKNPNWPSKG